MLKRIIIFFPLFFIGFLPLIANAQTNDTAVLAKADTGKIVQESDELIEEIITENKPLKKEKVEYFSQLTRYGFKNLFKQSAYTGGMKYSNQLNPFAETYMQDYLKVHKNSLIKMKDWGTPYFNLIDNIFTQYGLPKELKYLAVIESNLSTAATSWVGAGGPWQFMPYTARDYGLVVNENYDERRDYFKSTHAAAKYLLQLYKQMHDWLLVIAAYNGGPGRVYTAMKKSGSKDFWKLQYYLPTESRNHVKKFIATQYIMDENGTIGNYQPKSINYTDPYLTLGTLTLDEMEAAEKLTLSGKYNSLIITKNLGFDIVSFNRYNPAFDNLIKENGQYELTLPADKMQQFKALKYQILNECVQMLLSDEEIPNNTTVYPKKYRQAKRN